MEKVIYENDLSCREELEGFVLEGKAKMSFPEGALRLENELDEELGQKANFVLWCPLSFPSDIRIDWEFRPIKEPGLAMMFFAAKGQSGVPLFDDTLMERTGEYEQYHSGDINAFHVSYFRRKEPGERAFHTCNLRKSYGCNLVAVGADPIPDASENSDWFRMCIVKKSGDCVFLINDLKILEFKDDGFSFGDILTSGCIGFRQLAPMVAEYRNLKVTWI